MNLLKKISFVAIVAVLFCFVLNQMFFLSEQIDFLNAEHRGPWAKTLVEYKERLSLLRKDLDSMRLQSQKLGYITDYGHLFYVQYVLVPYSVEEGMNCDYIIGDFKQGTSAFSEIKDGGNEKYRGIVVLKDYKNGIVLLKKNRVGEELKR